MLQQAFFFDQEKEMYASFEVGLKFLTSRDV